MLMDSRMDTRIVGRPDGQADRRESGWTKGRAGGRVGGRMDRRTGELTDGRTALGMWRGREQHTGHSVSSSIGRRCGPAGSAWAAPPEAMMGWGRKFLRISDPQSSLPRGKGDFQGEYTACVKMVQLFFCF